jgi:hypothetical protein
MSSGYRWVGGDGGGWHGCGLDTGGGVGGAACRKEERVTGVSRGRRMMLRGGGVCRITHSLLWHDQLRIGS